MGSTSCSTKARRAFCTKHAVLLGVLTLLLGFSQSIQCQQFNQETGTRFPSPGPTEYTNQVAIADVDGDGDLDIAFANGGGFSSPGPAQMVRLYINDGSGVFSDETDDQMPSLNGYHRDVQFGDVDGNGSLDMVLARDFNQRPRLYLNDGTGNFTNVTTTQMPNATLGSSHAGLGDVDNDGDLDIWLTNGGANRFGAGQAQLYINDGNGFFTNETGARLPMANVAGPMDCSFGDIDGDFDLDLLEAHLGNNNRRLYINDGTGNFSNGTSMFPNDSTCYSYDLGDLDGDGDIDALGANGLSGSSRDIIAVNDGTGDFADETAARLPGNNNPNIDDNDSKFFDIDNDGDLDFIIGSLGSTERICVNDGNGNFELEPGLIDPVGDSTLDVEVGDLDGNGTLDVVTGQGESGNFLNRVYMNSGPADTLPPTFPNVEQLPDTMDSVGPYVVRVAIFDDMSGDNSFHRQSATLIYEVGAVTEEVDLFYMGGDLFRGEIPGQLNGSVIDYSFRATDWAGNTGTSETLQFAILGSPPGFRRGDVDNNGVLNALLEGQYLLDYGFTGGPAPVCDDSADVDDNGVVEPLIDGIYVLTWGFVGGPPPPAPFPDCGDDGTDDGIGCAATACP